MRIIVNYTVEAAIELNRILDALPGREEDRDRLLVEYLSELRELLIENRGELPGAFRDDRCNPTVFRIRSFDRVWVEYSFKDEKEWLWRRIRRITITSFRRSRSEGGEFRR